ncbi:MAG: D-alanyl-D-alanine carboxypeptidase family protein [Pseudomonadota bacterium]
MQSRQWMYARCAFVAFAALLLLSIVASGAMSAPYAAYVVDARNGKVLHSRNAETRLHPASLTKMMTLYIAFEAVEQGEISLDTKVTISKKAASEPPSKLGLRPGQKIKLRYLIRAAAVKSANDASTAIGEAISGSEAKFARRMNRTAKAIGMTRTTFKNMHGLTQSGHLSTARDMTLLGRQLLFDYPEYYNLFSRITANAGVQRVNHTNRRFLEAYRGADGIKTGYTRAAGFNLTASAKRRQERIIVTVFGGKSTASRNAKVAELMDLGFRKAPSRLKTQRPSKPAYRGNGTTKGIGTTIRATGAVTASKRPVLRPGTASNTLIPQVEAPVSNEDIALALQAATETSGADQSDANEKAKVIEVSLRPPQKVKRKNPAAVLEAPPKAEPKAATPEVVKRLSTSGGRQWGVNVGRYPDRQAAEKVLVTTALTEIETLQGSLRKVVRKSQGYDANFLGMTRETADLACRRLVARKINCFMIGP